MDKIKLYLLIFAVVITAASCNDEGINIPSFEIATDKTEYVAGEYVKFQVSGNPDVLTFYSGERGKRYEFATRTTAEGTPVLSFNSARANGSQAESIYLMISQDFAGTGMDDSITTVQNIAAATWTDITDRALWATSGSNKGSGNIDLSEFAGKPVYIAFKYKGYTGSIQNKWTISSLLVKNNLPDGTSYTIANHTTAVIANYGVSTTISPGWVGRNLTNQYKWVIGSSNFVITGSTTAATAAEAEAWCLSGPIDLTRVTPDVGIGIKSMSASLPEYSYQFTAAGEYKVTFVGNANHVYGAAEVVKQVDIVVQPAN